MQQNRYNSKHANSFVTAGTSLTQVPNFQSCLLICVSPWPCLFLSFVMQRSRLEEFAESFPSHGCRVVRTLEISFRDRPDLHSVAEQATTLILHVSRTPPRPAAVLLRVKEDYTDSRVALEKFVKLTCLSTHLWWFCILRVGSAGDFFCFVDNRTKVRASNRT